MRIALVTGASSGLGREFVRQLDGDPSIDVFWVIARRAERLEELAAEIRTPVRPLPLDLTDPAQLDELAALLEQERPEVRVLVCAAGFGKMGRPEDISLRDDMDMIDLDCRAAVAVTRLCLPHLVRGSRVLELCSTAGFQPVPGMGVYAASKAFLIRYTKELAYELLGSGIRVTAVCPYWVRDTEFIGVAQQGTRGDFRHFPLASRARSVVRLSLWGNRLGLWVVTPGIVCTLHRIAAKFIPHAIMVPVLDLIRRV